MTSQQQEHDERMKRALQQALPPTEDQPRAILEQDLWPAMLHRLEERTLSVPWFDWALLAALVVCVVLFPRAIPILLYHL